ncbi:hypothetical protein [Membranihabitans marinus]|uniref:hypothetical protein n=1 Tax=Membranihabitans marinus TaxID=1227546 RepID=UPI001F37E9AE|nr:hypothetical protein [Membranihabitans marinus]
MKQVKSVFIIIALAFLSGNTSANTPNTSSVIFSQVEGLWMADFTFSDEDSNDCLTEFYSSIDFNNLSIKEYNELYIEYIKSKFHLNVDSQMVPLSSGEIKSENHQTDIRFTLSDFPENFNTLHLRLGLFEESQEQNTLVKFIEGDKIFQTVLNRENQFELFFQNTDSTFTEIATAKIQHNIDLYLGLGIAIMLYELNL